MPAEWIERFRKKYDLTQEALGKLAGCSWELIDLLENMERGVTHHRIADRIADVCGASAKQRDSIVHKKHRGTYRPKKSRLYTGEKRKAAPPEKSADPRDVLQVIQINQDGEEIRRFANAVEAARACGHSSNWVRRRCTHGMSRGTNEFAADGTSYRYAAEWDRLKPDERREAVRSPRLEYLRELEKINLPAEYTWKGETHTVAEWAKIAHMTPETLRYRLRKGWNFERAIKAPVQARLKESDRG